MAALRTSESLQSHTRTYTHKTAAMCTGSIHVRLQHG